MINNIHSVLRFIVNGLAAIFLYRIYLDIKEKRFIAILKDKQNEAKFRCSKCKIIDFEFVNGIYKARYHGNDITLCLLCEEKFRAFEKTINPLSSSQILDKFMEKQ